MSELFIPLALAFAGFLLALAAYRDVRRGAARFYTLEREAILRRASFTLVGSALLFLGSIGYLIYERQPPVNDTAVAEETPTADEENGTAVGETATPFLESFPPLPTETATPDLSIPTPTPTRPICRAQVEGTFGNGLTLRDAPGDAQVAILAEGDLVSIVAEEDTVNDGNRNWRKVRSLFGDEGWAAEEFLTLGAGCEP